MATTEERTALHRNPFWVLGASSRDNRQRIVQLADEKALELDHDICQKARAELTNPRVRLAAEIGWLPGVSPRKAQQLAARLLSEPMAIESGIPALAHLNLMVAAFETLGEQGHADDVAVFIREIATEMDELVVAEIRRDINEDRTVSGFPEIHSDDQIEAELSDRKRHVRDAILGTLDRLPTDTIVSALTEAVDSATSNGEYHASELIDALVDAYEIKAHEFLQREAANISKLVQAARSVADGNRQGVGEVVERIDQVARNWDRFAQPIQVSAKARGISHGPSNEVAWQIRALAVDLFNDHDLVDESRRLTELLQDVFAEVPVVAERVEQDASAIAEAIGSREEWSREITYQAEVGFPFKSILSISPRGVSWKGKNYPLADVSRVRWGGVKHSVNGIPTGTTYTLAFGDDASESVVQLRREEVYSTFISKLWPAVCARLLVEMVTFLKAGRRIEIGDAAIMDEVVSLRRRRWMRADESVQCDWQDVHVWSHDGSFYIGAKNDKKVYSALSYVDVPNVHILESAIRMGFKRGVIRLSDILQKE